MDENLIKNVEINDLLKWNLDRSINPITGRKIKEGCKKYNTLENLYQKIFPDGYDFFDGNSRDPVSLNVIWIDKDESKQFIYDNYKNLIIYKDEKNFINTFEKETINEFITHNIDIHPITYLKIPQEVFEKVEYKKEEVIKSLSARVLEVFQIFNNVSIFLDVEDFTNLSNNNLDKLYYETSEFFKENIKNELILDIREYAKKQKKDIYSLNVEDFNKLEFSEKQNILLDSFEILLTFKNDEIKLMSYYIILGGLGLVSSKIQNAYPDFSFNF